MKISRYNYFIRYACIVSLFVLSFSCTQKEKQTQEAVDTERIYLPEEIDEPPKMPQSAD